MAARYRVDAWLLYDQLRLAYGSELVPAADVPALADQVEKSLGEYRTREETADIALAIVRLEGFDKEELTPGDVIYTTEITYHRDKEHLLMRYEAFREPNPGDVGFHYSPYDFDSNPEKHYFEQLLHQLALDPGEIEDVYFTGGVTDPSKSDFFVEYKDEKGKWRRYTPDFVIRRKPEDGGIPVKAPPENETGGVYHPRPAELGPRRVRAERRQSQAN